MIHVACALNGAELASRITLYNYAALDAREWISLDAQVWPTDIEDMLGCSK